MVQQYFTTTTVLHSMTDNMFLIFNAKKQNYCINFDTFKLKMYHRSIIETMSMFFMFLFLLLRGQRMVSEW